MPETSYTEVTTRRILGRRRELWNKEDGGQGPRGRTDVGDEVRESVSVRQSLWTRPFGMDRTQTFLLIKTKGPTPSH